jgi:hypothetical protein
MERSQQNSGIGLRCGDGNVEAVLLANLLFNYVEEVSTARRDEPQEGG